MKERYTAFGHGEALETFAQIGAALELPEDFVETFQRLVEVSVGLTLWWPEDFRGMPSWERQERQGRVDAGGTGGETGPTARHGSSAG
jgi:hypothetical protein